MADELKPCPFCGGKAKVASEVDWRGIDNYFVCCTDTECPCECITIWI